jgi:hypothetical protein
VLHCRKQQDFISCTVKPALQFAYQRGAEALPRAWSKYTPGTTANAQQSARQQPAEAEAQQPKKEKKKQKKKQRDAGAFHAARCLAFAPGC